MHIQYESCIQSVKNRYHILLVLKFTLDTLVLQFHALVIILNKS